MANLLHLESVIARDQLAPTLLRVSEAALQAALDLFDGPALRALGQDARRLLLGKDPAGSTLAEAWRHLQLSERRLKAPPAC